MPNRLSKETSSYLLQHQNNPVDWYPWGPEALEKAKKENKPILLSIGYSACHWCHVMEHESFENAEIAVLMNKYYINIKVDREERPDLDQIYQNVAQAMTHSGGWPLTVFLTPDLKPFYGGTYFPPEDRYGRPGFGKLLLALADAYENKKEDIQWNSKRLMDVITAIENIHLGESHKPAPDLDKIFYICQELLSHVDLEKGGIEGSPKFPNGMVFSLLWRVGLAKNWKPALDAVILTLRKMAQGGIYDHLRGGFHRYSVDSSWLVPHFEKMLYDNAVLMRLYSEILLTADEKVLDSEDRALFLGVLKSTFHYLEAEMKSQGGAFMSSQDADSEGHEGKFFVWSLAEIKKILEPQAAEIFILRFGITENGNFEDRKTVLHVALSVQEISKRVSLAIQEVEKILQNSIEKVLQFRNQRIAPQKDNKIITSWNGLMVSGLLWAAQALRKNRELEIAEHMYRAACDAFYFIIQNLVQKSSAEHGLRLWSTYQAGQAKLNAYLDDYAFMSMAALDMARFSQKSEEAEKYLDYAEGWIQMILKHFRDPHAPGYFFTSDDHESLIHRPKTVFDQAIPSGTGVTLFCLAALAEMGSLTGEGAVYEKELLSQHHSLFPAMEKNPYACGELLCASLLAVMGPVVVTGEGAAGLCIHPHVFQKSREVSSQDRFTLCHMKTCEKPTESLSEIQQSVMSKIKQQAKK